MAHRTTQVAILVVLFYFLLSQYIFSIRYIRESSVDERLLSFNITVTRSTEIGKRKVLHHPHPHQEAFVHSGNNERQRPIASNITSSGENIISKFHRHGPTAKNVNGHSTTNTNDTGETILYGLTTNKTTSILNYKWTRHPFWNGIMYKYCDWITSHQHKLNQQNHANTVVVVVNFTVNCRNPYRHFGLGTGNIVMAAYGLRLAAAAHGADFVFHCADTALNHPNDILTVARRQPRAHSSLQPFVTDVLPWLQGYHVAPKKTTQHDNLSSWTRFSPPIPDAELSCEGFAKHPLHYMIDAVRQDLRTLAISLLGDKRGWVRDGSGRTASPSLVSNITVDDAAIHFRCGDVLLINTNTYGLLGFDVYRRFISPRAQTIGIITQSFDPDQNRKNRDEYTTQQCHYLVQGLVHYLTRHFPNATVSVRNGHDETSAMDYARLVLANQSFSGLSTFSIFPSLASFGTSYIPKGRLTYFCPPIAEQYQNVKMIDGQILTSKAIQKLKLPSKILARLVSTKKELK